MTTSQIGAVHRSALMGHPGHRHAALRTTMVHAHGHGTTRREYGNGRLLLVLLSPTARDMCVRSSSSSVVVYVYSVDL